MEIKDMKVLICDDSMVMRKQIAGYIEDIGCNNIIYANNGSVAVEMYKSERPNIVYMDVVMPVLTGVEAIKAIKEFDPSANICVVSSAGTRAIIREALSAGAMDFIQKPIESDPIIHAFMTVAKGEN